MRGLLRGAGGGVSGVRRAERQQPEEALHPGGGSMATAQVCRLLPHVHHRPVSVSPVAIETSLAGRREQCDL